MRLCCRVYPWSLSHSLPARRRRLAHLGPLNCSVLHNGASCEVSSLIASSPFSSPLLLHHPQLSTDKTTSSGGHVAAVLTPKSAAALARPPVRVNHRLAFFDHRPSSTNPLLTRRFVHLSSDSLWACTVRISHCLFESACVVPPFCLKCSSRCIRNSCSPRHQVNAMHGASRLHPYPPRS